MAWVINQSQIQQASVSVSNHLQVSFFSDRQLDETRQDSDTSLRSHTWDRLPVEKAMHYELSDSEPRHVFSHHPFHITAYLGSSAQIADAHAGTLTTTDTS